MINISSKKILNDYSESDFAILVNEISSVNGGEAYQDKLIAHFIQIVPNPEGSDLLFWVPDNEATAVIIIEKIKAYCQANKLIDFRNE